MHPEVSSVVHPVLRLVGFEHIELEACKSAIVTFPDSGRDFPQGWEGDYRGEALAYIPSRSPRTPEHCSETDR
ncbi:hypothetical protein [Nocardia noduli]|uniref:hypothetical protein n=1 Tax=Nocardia noduli TaxID=2815722 RepID=UPI001C228090